MNTIRALVLCTLSLLCGAALAGAVPLFAPSSEEALTPEQLIRFHKAQESCSKSVLVLAINPGAMKATQLTVGIDGMTYTFVGSMRTDPGDPVWTDNWTGVSAAGDRLQVGLSLGKRYSGSMEINGRYFDRGYRFSGDLGTKEVIFFQLIAPVVKR